MQIFINYRYDDTAWVAGVLHQKLSERYGSDRVFLDSQKIPLGEPYPRVLWSELVRSTVVLVIIGRQWLNVRADSPADPATGAGPRRIDLPDDDLRREIELALDLGLKVVPILVDGAPSPAEQDLPDRLRRLGDLEYVRINAGTVRYEIGRLLDELDRLLADVDGFPPPPHRPTNVSDASDTPTAAPHFAEGGVYNAGGIYVNGDTVARDKIVHPRRGPS